MVKWEGTLNGVQGSAERVVLKVVLKGAMVLEWCTECCDGVSIVYCRV